MEKTEGLIYPELSYAIIGCAFEVYNELGYGHAEKHYQKAMAVALKSKSIEFVEQYHLPLKFKGEFIRKGFCDFLVKDTVIIELKKNNRFAKAHIDQVNQYLKMGEKKLAILINFTPTTVIFKRMVNLY
jgi:GxxExxY protein